MKRAKLGSVEFSVVSSESITQDADVTEKSVEQGQDVADHVKPKPLVIALSGVITGDDASSKLQQLYKYQKEGELLTYIGRSSNSNMVIKNFKSDHNGDIRNGYHFSMTINRVRIAVGEEVAITVNPTTKQSDPKTKTQTKKKGNKGKQQPKNKKVTPTPKTNSKQKTAIGPLRTPTIEERKQEMKAFVSPGQSMKSMVNSYSKKL